MSKLGFYGVMPEAISENPLGKMVREMDEWQARAEKAEADRAKLVEFMTELASGEVDWFEEADDLADYARCLLADIGAK